MSQLPKKLLARLSKDNPWLVAFRPPKEIYSPKQVRCTKLIRNKVPQLIELPAKEAREQGFEISPEIPDQQIVEVKVIQEKVEEQISWETRLCFSGIAIYQNGYQDEDSFIVAQKKKPQKIREELSAALESPLTYLQYTELINQLQEYIEYWKSNDMSKEEVKPFALVLMGVHEPEDDQDNENRFYTREAYLIKNQSPTGLTLVNYLKDEFEVELPSEVLKSCVSYNFIIFAPSNLHFYDYYTEELLV